jgi:hypothetical protein
MTNIRRTCNLRTKLPSKISWELYLYSLGLADELEEYYKA